MGGLWSIEFHPACESWALALEQPDAEALLAATDDRFDDHQAAIEVEQGTEKRTASKKTRSSKGRGRR